MGDMVLEVNGQNVVEKHLEDVIMLMEEGGKCLTLLVKEQTGECEKQENTPSTHKVKKT